MRAKFVILTAALSFLAFLATAAALAFHSWTRAATNDCIENLRQLDAAKIQWAEATIAATNSGIPPRGDWEGTLRFLENSPITNSTPSWEDIKVYICNGMHLTGCPRGGRYSINRGLEAPECSFPGHSIKGPPPQASPEVKRLPILIYDPHPARGTNGPPSPHL